jgi:kynurenine formamidase
VSELPRNWGRWGEHDERGALNIVGAKCVLDAVSLVRRGEIFELGGVLDRARTPVPRFRQSPTLVMTRDGGDDILRRRTRGGPPVPAFAEDLLFISPQAGTHVDALCHVFRDGKMYNGYESIEVTSTGSRRCGVQNMGSVVTIGALFDLTAVTAPGELVGGVEVTVAMLERAAADRGFRTLPPGSAALLYTGWRTTAGSDRAFMAAAPGISMDAARWLADQDVAIVGADTMGVEVGPSGSDTSAIPVHEFLMAECGIYLLELLELEALAKAEVGQFAFVMCPLAITGATGSPVRPIAIV